jgi:hypothetical protein
MLKKMGNGGSLFCQVDQLLGHFWVFFVLEHIPSIFFSAPLALFFGALVRDQWN